MASPSDLEQQIAAAIRSVPPVPTVPGAGVIAPDRAAAAALQRTNAAQTARATDAVHARLESARTLAGQTFSRRLDQLKGLKDELRALEDQLRETRISLQSREESECGLVKESESIPEAKARSERECRFARERISKATTTNEQFRASVANSRDKRDDLLAITSKELLAEPLEADSEEDAVMEMRQKQILWFDKVMGFRVITVGIGGGVKFVFNKIDPQHPDKECSFRINSKLQCVECDPYVRDIEKAAKAFDLSKCLFEFVRVAREKFQSSFMNDVSAAPFPSPRVMPVNNRSEDAHNATPSSSKKDVKLLRPKREATDLSPGVSRRSRRARGGRKLL